MSGRKDYYKILGVHREADESEISSAFYMLVQRYHPDICRDESVSDHHIRDINEAYEVLSDVSKRRDYDRTYSPFVRVHVRNRNDPHNSVVPSAASRGSAHQIVAQLPVSPEEARYGSSCEVKIRKWRPCSNCDGVPATMTCPHCGGARRIEDHRRLIRVQVPAGTSDGDIIRLADSGQLVLLTVQIRPYW